MSDELGAPALNPRRTGRRSPRARSPGGAAAPVDAPRAEEGVASLSLPSSLDLSAAAPLRDAILAHRGQDLELDAARVERIGGLCLQILLSARQTWQADGKAFRITNVQDSCRNSLRLVQAAAALGMEE